jgi:hypothetical protein
VGACLVWAEQKLKQARRVKGNFLLLCCPNAFFTCSVSRFARHDLVALSALAKHCLQIRHDDIGSLVCCEVAALG